MTADAIWSKAALLELVQAELDAWRALVQTVPPERMTEPGAMGDWSFKDVVAHLNGWRRWLLTRLQAAANDEKPVQEWAGELPANPAFEDVNQWLYAQYREHPAAALLAETEALLDQIMAAIEALPEADLVDPQRFAWMHGDALASTIHAIAHEHFVEEHAPALREWLARRA